MTSTNQELWTRVKGRLRAEVGEDIYTSWFARMDLEGIDAETVRMSVPTRFLQELDSIALCRTRARLLAGRAGEGRAHRTDRALGGAASAGREGARSQLPPRETRDVKNNGGDLRFAGGAGLGRARIARRLAARSAADVRELSWSAAPTRWRMPPPSRWRPPRRSDAVMFNPLYIHAGVGLGKTHLLQAITWAGNAAGERKVLYLTAEKFMYGFVSALRTQTAIAFKEALRGIDVLVIDDLQFLQGKIDPGRVLPHAQRADRCRPPGGDRRRPPAVRSRKPRRPRALAAGRRPRGRDGLARRGAAAGDPQGAGGRRRALHHPGFDVPPPVLAYIAKTVTHNGRDLEGALNRLLAHNKLTGQPVTLEMAEREVRDLIRPQEPKRVKIEDIQRVVARQYNVSRADLLSSRRTANVVRPRQVAMYLAKTLTLRSLPEIGRRFGGRDHTTVLHAVRKIEGLVGNDTALAEEIEIC